MSKIRKIGKIEPAYPFAAYAHIISPLPEDEGGGFLVTLPDLPGCMSDGETEEEAIANGRDAFASWVSARHDAGKQISPPSLARNPFQRYPDVLLPACQINPCEVKRACQSGRCEPQCTRAGNDCRGSGKAGKTGLTLS